MRPSMLGVKNHNGPASVKEEKKLTFEEWYSQFPKLPIKDLENVRKTKYANVWKAAQENVPSQAPGTGA